MRSGFVAILARSQSGKDVKRYMTLSFLGVLKGSLNCQGTSCMEFMHNVE